MIDLTAMTNNLLNEIAATSSSDKLVEDLFDLYDSPEEAYDGVHDYIDALQEFGFNGFDLNDYFETEHDKVRFSKLVLFNKDEIIDKLLSELAYFKDRYCKETGELLTDCECWECNESRYNEDQECKYDHRKVEGF